MHAQEDTKKKDAEVFPAPVLELRRLARRLTESIDAFRKLLPSGFMPDAGPDSAELMHVLSAINKMNDEAQLSLELALACREAIGRRDISELRTLQARLIHHMEMPNITGSGMRTHSE